MRREIEELRASRRRLVWAFDSERRAIERDLHGGVQQRLVALAVSLQLVEALADSDLAITKTLVDAMGRDVQLALDEASRLAQRIYPSNLAAAGFAAALRSAAASAGVPVDVRVMVSGSYAPEVLRTVYRAFLDALDCAAPGAEAAVTLREEEGVVVFEIVEDGSRPDVAFDHLRDSIEALDGRLAIEWKPGGSLRISGWLPLG